MGKLGNKRLSKNTHPLASVQAGEGVIVDSTDEENPIIISNGIITVQAGTGISININDPKNIIITNTGVLSLSGGANVTISGTAQNPVVNVPVIGGQVDSVGAGTNVTITGTAANPIVNSSATAPNATESTRGIAEIATQAETNTGSDDTRFVTPKKMSEGQSAVIIAGVPAKFDFSDWTGDGDRVLQFRWKETETTTTVGAEIFSYGTPFSTRTMFVAVTRKLAGGAGLGFSVSAQTASGFTIDTDPNDIGSGQEFMYFAVGF